MIMRCELTMKCRDDAGVSGIASVSPWISNGACGRQRHYEVQEGLYIGALPR